MVPFFRWYLLLLSSLFSWRTATAQYAPTTPTIPLNNQFSDFLSPDYSCNCGTPVLTGSDPVSDFPDCGDDGTYPNAFTLSLEFLGGGSNIDPAAIENKYWMIRFRNLDNLCSVWTFPFAIGDSVYEATRTGNSIRVSLQYSDLDPDNPCMTSGFEGYNWDYQVYQICDYPVFDCYRPSVRDTFNMQLIQDMFSVDEEDYGYCETDVYVDMAMGERRSIGNDSTARHWNDVRASLQYINICGLPGSLFPAAENYEIVLKDSLGNAVDQAYFTGLGLDNGDFVLMDTVWYEDQRCIRLTYRTDGDGSYNRWGVFAEGVALDCNNEVPVMLDEMSASDFRVSWSAGMQTRGHRFKIRVYQGGDCTGLSSDTTRNRPNTDNTQVFETLVLASDPRLTKTSATGNAGNGYVASDGFSVTMSELGFLPEGCTCYQVFVYQVCDGMDPDGTSGYWGAALGRTFAGELSCESVAASLTTSPEVCEVIGGSLSFELEEVICAAYEVSVYLEGGGIRDTFHYYSSGYSNGTRVVSDREFRNSGGGPLVFAHEDTLMHGSYTVVVELRDTMSPVSMVRCTLSATLELVDLLKPSAVVVLEDWNGGARFELDDAGGVTGSSGWAIEDGVIDLGDIPVPAGSCGTTLDFLLDVYDECAVNYEKIEVSVLGVNGKVSGTVLQGQADTMRTATVQLGSGAFVFDFLIKDGGDETTWNRLRFKGRVRDQSAPVVRIPGNLVYQVGSCSDTTSVYVQLSAEDGCDGSIEVLSSHINGALNFVALGNGLFRASGVAAGAYGVVVGGVEDGSGNVAPDKEFIVQVLSGGVSVDRQIVGAGDLVLEVPGCSGTSDITFDLFIVDGCAVNPSFDYIRAGDYGVEGALTGSRFRIRGLRIGERVEVEAGSGTAQYNFAIEVVELLSSAAPEIRLTDDLSFTLPVCSLSGEEVGFGVSVRDDCEDTESLLLNTQFILDTEEIFPVNYAVTGKSIYFEFRRRISMSDHNKLFTVFATDGEGNVTTRSVAIRVLQAEVSDDYSCGDQLNVLLGDNCRTVITPSMVLKGDEGVICNALLQVVVEKKDRSGNFEGYYTLNEVQEVGLFKYAVLPAGEAYLYYNRGRIVGVARDAIICWGTLLVEDKTQPEQDCPAAVYEGLSPVAYNYFSGYLSEDRVFYPQVFSCYRSIGPDYPSYLNENEPHYYETITFRPSKDGIYTFSLEADFDGMMALFQQNGDGHRSGLAETVSDGWFDRENPCSNIVMFGQSVYGVDSEGGLGNVNDTEEISNSWEVINTNPVQRLSLSLRSGREYTLLVTTAAANVRGDYAVRVSADGGSEILEEVLLGQRPSTDAGLAILDYWDPTTDEWDNEVESWTAFPVVGGLERHPLYCGDLDRLVIQPTEERCYRVLINTETGSGVVPGNVEIGASLSAKLYRTGFPVVRDNCGDVEVCVTDRVNQRSDCGGAYIDRSFRIRDSYGNKGASCVQRIWFSVPSLRNVVLPSFTQYMECDEGEPLPTVTGYPFVRSAFGYHDLANEWCNLAAVYKDQTLEGGCSGQRSIRRTWTLLDWCRPGNSIIYNQLVKTGDYSAPEFVGITGDTLQYSVGPFACKADIRVPSPELRDNCSATLNVEYEVQVWEMVKQVDHFGNEVGEVGSWQTIRQGVPGDFVRGLALGNQYRFRYLAWDDCGNESEQTQPFVVLDEMAPVISCGSALELGLGGGSYTVDNTLLDRGYGRIAKGDLVESVEDYCGESWYVVRREVAPESYGYFDADADGVVLGEELELVLLEGVQVAVTPWDEGISFFCGDAGDIVRVWIRAEDAAGNSSECVMEVRVKDQVAPVCVAPVDYTGDCSQLPEDFNPPASMKDYTAMDVDAKRDLHRQLDALFGSAELTDNCGAPVYEQELAGIDWHCGTGSLVRRFWALDREGNRSVEACEQVVQITGVHEYGFLLPADIRTDVCGATAAAQELEQFTLGCDVLAVSYSDKVYASADTACYLVFRNWEVVNWCQFGKDDLSLAIPFEVSRDEDGNGVAGDAAVWVRYGVRTEIDRDADGANGILRASEYSGGYYRYTQILSVYDEVAPELVITAQEEYCSYESDCTAEVRIGVVLRDSCTSDQLSLQAYLLPDGKTGTRIGLELVGVSRTEAGLEGWVELRVPLGEHEIELVGRDGCGNSISAQKRIRVKDCKAPTLVVKNAVAVTLMPQDTNGDGRIDGGGMRVWANEFVLNQGAECSGPVQYSIHLNGFVETKQESIMVGCGEAGQTLEVIIAAWDASGNVDYAQSYLIVQDNQNLCGGSTGGLSISGLIATEADHPVEDVEVTLSGSAYEKMVSGVNGNYVFEGLEVGKDYTIIPLLNEDYTNGVTTYDLIEIGKHILNVKQLDSPYKLIAADVDNSRSITSLDLVKLRRLILHVDVRLSNNTSWRFVDAKYRFPDPSNPWSSGFPELLNLNNYEGDASVGDFVAVKIGDVTLDAVANRMMTRPRSESGVLSVEVPELKLEAGKSYEVPFYVRDLSEVSGYQFALQWDREAVEIEDIQYGIAVSENFGLRYAGAGVLTTSWNGSSPGGRIFGLKLRALREVRLSEVLSLTPRYTPGEAYGQSGTQLGVALNFMEGEGQAGYVLYQNKPNPFGEDTEIGFYLPVGGDIVLTIRDVSGKVLKVMSGYYREGYHSVVLSRGELSAGVMYYTLETGGFTATRKMILIR